MPFRVNRDDRLLVIQQNRRWMSQVLARLAINDRLAIRLARQVDQRNRITLPSEILRLPARSRCKRPKSAIQIRASFMSDLGVCA